MPSTFDPLLRLELQATGENAATWGGKTNTNLELIAQAISGVIDVALSGTSYTLTANNAATDQARNAVLNFTGALTANCNVIVPSADKVYTVRNSTTGGFSVVVKTSAGLGVTVASGLTQSMYCDGTNVVASGALFDSVTNMGSAAGTKNLIINGNPVINQRAYVSGTATSGANQYTLDRWRVVVSGQALSWTDSAGIRTVTFPVGGGEQVIEALNNLGGVHTLSWTGTATATVNGTSVANGGQVTLTGGTNVTIRMSGGTASQIQLEPGSVATPFERRSYGQELALCQRYFYMIPAGTYGFACPSTGGFAAYQSYVFKQTMRVPPTITWNYGPIFNVTAITPVSVNADYATVQYVGTTSTNSTWVLNASPASAEL
jgi:hypothetical protein